MDNPLLGKQGVIFDLEDTLYDKTQWLVPALEYAANQNGLNPELVVELASEYIRSGAPLNAIFNHVLLETGQCDSAMNIRALSALAMQYNPTSDDLQMFPGAPEALRKMSRKMKLAVIAEGRVECQKAKVAALKLDHFVDAVVYPDTIDGLRSRKPDPRAYTAALKALKLREDQVIFVGDNPYKDFIGARELGITTVRVLTGEFAGVTYPRRELRADFAVTSLARMPELFNYTDITHCEGLVSADHLVQSGSVSSEGQAPA